MLFRLECQETEYTKIKIKSCEGAEENERKNC